MAKKIKNPINVHVGLSDGVFVVRGFYGVTSEYAINERRELPVTLKPKTLQDIIEETMLQIHAKEGTTEME